MNKRPRPLPSDLHSAQHDIQRWRKGNDRRRRIPEPFWRQAVALARVHSINRVAVAMPLSPARIAQRLRSNGASDGPADGKKQQVKFVELARPAAALGAPATAGFALELADGSSRRMRVTGTDAHGAAHILTAFFGSGATS